MEIKIIQGDITKFEVDAIVNAANSSLLGGGGVDGAIHRAAGRELLEECRRIRRTSHPEGLPTGKAVITKGYNLKAKYVIHTVGPVYGHADINLLAECYKNSLKLAEENNCRSIAFPAISTGVYSVPIELSAKIVKDAVKNFKSGVIKEIYLVLYGSNDYRVYKKEFEA
ncbi:MAG: O-acetyl-ADP-ribose deacetylase [Firmicutes bacterium]|nr:O-acetyl-ADP-ribose deacetylase [Bacillota bacterium]